MDARSLNQNWILHPRKKNRDVELLRYSGFGLELMDKSFGVLRVIEFGNNGSREKIPKSISLSVKRSICW